MNSAIDVRRTDPQCRRYTRLRDAFLIVTLTSAALFIVTASWMLLHWRNWHWSP